jgi:alpha-glucosidase
MYEGEELGLGEATLRFEDLADPYGIRFWPEFKGRDGCRTPMVWESNAPNGGFSTGKPWLPVPEAHIARAANREAGDPRSVLARYRQLLAFRKQHPALREGSIALLDAPADVLAFERRQDDERILCVFNLGRGDADFALPAGASVAALEGHGFTAAIGSGGTSVRVPAAGAFFGRLE